MAIALSDLQINQVGNRKVVTGTVTFDSSYVTNGEPFTIAEAALSQLTDLRVDPTTLGYVPRWNANKTSPTIVVFYGDNNNAADGPLIEVPNATNLSAESARFTAVGF